MNRLKVILFSMALIPAPIFAQQAGGEANNALSCPSGDDSIACKHKEQVEAIWVDMNKSATYLTDELIQNPDSAIEAGCLNDIMQVDLSVITVDPYGIWNSVYAGLKDQLMNMACSAVEDKLNEASAYLDAKLEAPMGLGSVSLGQSGRANSFSDLQESRVYMNDREAQEAVVEKVFGEYPRVNQRRWTEQEIEQRRIENGGPSTRSRRSAQEEKVRSVLNVNRIFGESDKGNKDE